ncbi:arginase [Desulfopila sp. IMCC35008]|uniref:arginase n=1 Tax=Desulfopila sp. IMCC35008 TaxID=2653858 RepID=UPI0013D63F3F|nr:arginase [Desulfopila sp. IMCC35008]
MTTKKVRIIGVPMDLGQNQRGVDMGPSAIRYAHLAPTLQELGYTTEDSGNINIPGHYSLKDTSFQERLAPIRKGCEAAYQLGREAVANDEIPLFLGGDHSSSVGTIGGVTHESPAGVIWVDAHGDFNTPATSESCNVHGMSLAILLGKGSPELVNVGRPGPKILPQHVVMLGIRDLDREEKKMLRDSGVTIFTMRDIDEYGMHAVLVKTLKKLEMLDRIHISLDMDVMDPISAPGVGTPSHGGLTYREGQLIMETIADSGKLLSADIMEINPILDVGNQTAKMAVSLAASLFGKSII